MLNNGRAVARTLIGGGGGGVYSYIRVLPDSRLASFEINFISKETSRAEPEYMNINPPINALATALNNGRHLLSIIFPPLTNNTMSVLCTLWHIACT